MNDGFPRVQGKVYQMELVKALEADGYYNFNRYYKEVVSVNCGQLLFLRLLAWPCTEQALQTRSWQCSWTDTKDTWTPTHNMFPVMCSVDTTDILLQGYKVWAAWRRPTGTQWLTQEARIAPHAAGQAATRENLSLTDFTASPVSLTVLHGYWLGAER